MERTSAVLDEFGKPFVHRNGKPRPELIQAFLSSSPLSSRANLSYDAARDSTEFANHWANSDALDADSANSREVRHKLMRRSRYEAGSNGYYAGILRTHCNMLIGSGPTLRMLSGTENFNQLVEREYYRWSLLVNLRHKLWCMAHAMLQDGEAFAILQTNPALRNGVQLDLTPIEAEQCQTPYPQFRYQPGYTDGIRFDPVTGEVLWYDILPYHPGSSDFVFTQDAIQLPPSQVIHWFEAVRPGAHRGIPKLTSTLNLGASSRRMREATLAAAETAADLNVMLTTQLTPDTSNDPVAPFSTLPIQKRMLTAAPMGWQAEHFKSEHPNATYAEFNRSQLGELGSPICHPVNLVMRDSSTYSFASGKLDMKALEAELNAGRLRCAERVLDRIFAAWFREWTILSDRRDIPPEHQWDWPAHPIIDAEAEARAADVQLKNGSLSISEYHSNLGRDYEDDLMEQARDAFGEADESSIDAMRKINVLRNTPAQALPFVAQLLGVEAPTATSTVGAM